MKVLFYSNNCVHSKKMLTDINTFGIIDMFTLINVDITPPPDGIDIVPTIVDSDINQPLKGKKAFEYINNFKYFNNPTNNIEYLASMQPNPIIEEDEKASKSKIICLELNKNKTSEKLNQLFELNEMQKNYEIAKNNEVKINTSIAKEHHPEIIEPIINPVHVPLTTNETNNVETSEIRVTDKKMSLLLRLKKK